MASEQEQRERRAAQNEALFRSANERLKELNDALDGYSPYGSWFCECFRRDCSEMIEMTVGEYEKVRAESDQFAVVADRSHVDYSLETVIARCDRYWIVKKLGTAASVSRDLDERAA